MDQKEFLVFVGAPKPEDATKMIWKRKGKVKPGTEMEFIIGLIQAQGWSIFELGGMPVTEISEEDLRNELGVPTLRLIK